MKLKTFLMLSSIILGGVGSMGAEVTKKPDIPIKKVTIYSSGVGYFEHNGTVENSLKLALPFEKKALNDVLKSITIYDPNTKSPRISYPSEETVRRTLESLSVNLGDNPSIEMILNSLRGAEIRILAPDEITGKIIGAQIKKTKAGDNVVEESILSILSNGQIQVVKTNEIVSYSFMDAKITEDMNRALELILNSKNENIKNINIHLSGDKKRDIEISYVMASPIWKATYRFDLGQEKPYLQGWAIVDNVGEMDWTNVELSLVTGKPVSFIQELYTPYHLTRPTLPLSIAGFADAKIYESGYESHDMVEEQEIAEYAPRKMAAGMSYLGLSKEVANDRISMSDIKGANTKNAGELFVFTAPEPVTLERQQSAMIPLVQTNFEATKVSIFDGRNIRQGVSANPALGVKFKNNSGMKLPAGPITVYDDGTYVGDALLEFLPENETRMVSYGDDLSVTGSVAFSRNVNVDFITVVKGTLNINTKDIYERVYKLKNIGNKNKNIILEHPITRNSKLILPEKFSEKTDSVYRFEMQIDATKEIEFSVKEEVPLLTSISILDLNIESLLSYSTSGEIPEKVKEMFKRASEVYTEIQTTNDKIDEFINSRESKVEEQERIRANIDAVKSDSVQGKEYIKKLTSIDKEIEGLDKNIVDTKNKLDKLRVGYNDYVKSLNWEGK
ncbi:hypothetical protein [Fusobacterium sp. PH5-44]|uniref:hypothetical protein n=1 Tax=unclassified Fusobacterium TaxID=2648384 RepID=UPI003D20DCD4